MANTSSSLSSTNSTVFIRTKLSLAKLWYLWLGDFTHTWPEECNGAIYLQIAAESSAVSQIASNLACFGFRHSRPNCSNDLAFSYLHLGDMGWHKSRFNRSRTR